MPFGMLILIRILFIACMVFIIGYVFGNFSTRPALKTITKIASIVAILLFIAVNILFFRFAGWRHDRYSHHHYQTHCSWNYTDSTALK